MISPAASGGTSESAMTGDSAKTLNSQAANRRAGKKGTEAQRPPRAASVIGSGPPPPDRPGSQSHFGWSASSQSGGSCARRVALGHREHPRPAAQNRRDDRSSATRMSRN